MENLVRSYFADEPILIEIARCESEWRQFDPVTGDPLRGKANSADVGLFQINEKYHKARASQGNYNIYDPMGNMAYALKLYKEKGTKPWNASAGCWNRTNPDSVVAVK